MPTLLKNYPLKLLLPENPERLDYFRQLVEEATQQTLKKLWSEEQITRLGTTSYNAQAIVGPKNVILTIAGENYYLPFRVKMGIAERIGRILRSQYKRMCCYYDCRKAVELAGQRTSKRLILKIVQRIFVDKNGYPKYKQVMVEQTLAMIANWQEKLGIDLDIFTYTHLVEPKIQRFVFPFGPDNHRILECKREGDKINYRFKLPKTLESKSQKDWE